MNRYPAPSLGATMLARTKPLILLTIFSCYMVLLFLNPTNGIKLLLFTFLFYLKFTVGVYIPPPCSQPSAAGLDPTPQASLSSSWSVHPVESVLLLTWRSTGPVLSPRTSSEASSAGTYQLRGTSTSASSPRYGNTLAMATYLTAPD